MLDGFTYLKTIKELKSANFNWPQVLEVNGIYFIVYKSLNKPEFLLPKGTGGWFKKKNPNVSKEKLNENWINFKPSEDKILYIGRAIGMNTLKARIRLYMKFGSGEPVPHWGGRYIWQIANSDDLEIYWKEDKNSKTTERDLLREFKRKHDQRLPFANLRM